MTEQQEPVTAEKKNEGRPVFWTDDKIKTALIKAGGNKTQAAVLLAETHGVKCSRETVSRACAANPELEEAVKLALQGVLDLCEASVVNRAVSGNQRDQHFLLGRRHPEYRRKNENMGKDGGPIEVRRTDELTDEELEKLTPEDINALIRAEEIKRGLHDKPKFEAVEKTSS